jgi:lactate racemase
VPLARQICQVEIPHLYDLVIASAGGYPKDINLYQAQKALTHAALMTRDGGTILLLAACAEGVGSAGYERFMEGITSFEQVFARFKAQGFQVGPHKAFQIARDASRVHIIILSEMDPDKVKSLLLTPAHDINQVIPEILQTLPPNPRIAVMPIGPITIPVIK